MSRSSLPDGPGLFGWQGTWSFINRPRYFYAWLRRRYGEIATLKTATAPLVIALTSEGARQVLTANPEGYNAFHKEPFTGLTGVGSLWVIDGLRHRRERQLLSPRFSAHRIRSYGEVIKQVTLLHTDRWQTRQAIRAYEVMLDISRDIIFRVMFGVERGNLMDEGRRTLKRLLRCVHPLLSVHHAFQAWWFPPWIRYWRAKQEFAKFVAGCLAERRAHGNESDDVLGTMLATRYDDGTCMSDEEIRDELITILLAGHETTAVALSWALYELGRHPALLDRLRQELDALGPDPAPDLIVKQPYLAAVCDETLRLHSILTEIGRITRVPCELLGHQLPAGVGIGVGIGAIHQDPSLYSDPDEFRPERFIDRTYGPFEFMPFGGGHRRCLGAHLSDYEMRIALATIVTRWDLELAGEEREVRHNIGTGPKHGVRMRVSGRRRLTSSTRTPIAVSAS